MIAAALTAMDNYGSKYTRTDIVYTYLIVRRRANKMKLEKHDQIFLFPNKMLCSINQHFYAIVSADVVSENIIDLISLELGPF